MSQPSTQWTSDVVDPLFSAIKQESYTDTPPGEFFQQNASAESLFSSTSDGFSAFAFPSIDNSLDCDGLPSASTPDFSRYAFAPDSSAPYDLGTPQPYPAQRQQTYAHPPFAHRPLPFRAHTNNTSFAQPSQGDDRRRSLSHSDVDRIAVHPTFVRLQGSQSSRSTTPEDNTTRHGRSVSQGPTYLGRPLKNAVPYAFSRSPLISGTSIGTPMSLSDKRGSRKRVRYPRYEDDDEDNEEVEIRHVMDPVHLAHSRRIIEIGAMAVRNHHSSTDNDEAKGDMKPRERILKKLEDVEMYLQQHEADNEDALKGCGMIREALVRRTEGGDAVGLLEYQDTPADDGLEVPSKMMPGDGMGLFGGCFGDENFMGLLETENERLE
jgi:hypothetical protein